MKVTDREILENIRMSLLCLNKNIARAHETGMSREQICGNTSFELNRMIEQIDKVRKVDK